MPFVAVSACRCTYHDEQLVRRGRTRAAVSLCLQVIKSTQEHTHTQHVDAAPPTNRISRVRVERVLYPPSLSPILSCTPPIALALLAPQLLAPALVRAGSAGSRKRTPFQVRRTRIERSWLGISRFGRCHPAASHTYVAI
eukprot:scaffold39433_cov20-Tisochrysis_lutea.AAC.1